MGEQREQVAYGEPDTASKANAETDGFIQAISDLKLQ